jgi:hypothetical protein
MIERIYSYFVVAYVAFKHLISHDNKYIIMLNYSNWRRNDCYFIILFVDVKQYIIIPAVYCT